MNFQSETIVPEMTCSKFSPELYYETVTGFKFNELELIIEQAIPNYVPGRTSTFKPNQNIFLAITYLRQGLKIKQMKTLLGTSESVTRTAIDKGFHALSRSFKECNPVGGAPTLQMKLNQHEKSVIPTQFQES